MKKSLFALAALATVFAFSCTKEQQFPDEQLGSKGITLTVSAENNITKGTYSDAGQFTWAAGDKIGVNAWMNTDPTDHWPEPLTLKDEDAGKTVGNFDATGFDTSTKTYGTVAFYPWNGYASGSDEEAKGTNVGGDGYLYVHQKPVIAYNNDSGNPQHLLPLAATISDNQTTPIQFKQLGAGVKVSLKDVPAKANKISLTIPGKNITGWYTIEDLTKINNGEASISSTDGSDSMVAITFDQSTAARDMDFVFPVPTGEIPGMTVTLYEGDRQMWTRSAPAQPTLSRGQVLENASLTVKNPEEAFYLFGWINGANYACEGDANNLGKYKFVNGKLIVKFESDSYVGIKDANGTYFMTEGWLGDVTSAALNPTGGLTSPDKMKIPGGITVELSMVKTGNTITLSYEPVNVTLYFTLATTDFTDLKLCCEAIGTLAWPGSSLDLTDTEEIMLKTYYKYVTDASNVWGKTPDIYLYGVASSNWATQASPVDFTSKEKEYFFELSDKYGTITQLPGRPTPPTPVAITIDGDTDDWTSLTTAWTAGNNDRVKAWKATYDASNFYIYMEIDEAYAQTNGKWGTYVQAAFDLDNNSTTPTGVVTDYGFGNGWEAIAIVFPFTNGSSASAAVLANDVNDSHLDVPFGTEVGGVTSMGHISGGTVYLEFAVSRTAVSAPSTGPVLVRVGCGSHLLNGQYLFLE